MIHPLLSVLLRFRSSASVYASAYVIAFAVLGVHSMTTPRDASAQKFTPNYDEARVPEYTLPDPLVDARGQPITRADQWPARRKEILDLFASHVYGRTPTKKVAVHATQLEPPAEALDGKAFRKQVRLRLGDDPNGPHIDLLIYAPRTTTSPSPAFLALNFRGNHSICSDRAIRLPTSWMRKGPGVQDHRATEQGRGLAASRWPVEHIIDRGYALVTAYYGDIDPDFDDGFQNGVHPLFYRSGQTKPAPDEWGSIGAWAWGLSRALDYLQTEPLVDGRRVAVMGHSRLGKTALWAGAQDTRFALVISNDSGCGGAALSRREFGETVERINESFPHWFCDNFTKYNDRVSDLPVDQHMLIALVAPRPCYVASAQDDRWADPKGEFLSVRHAAPVYSLLLSRKVFPYTKMPAVDHPLFDVLGYHIRTGKHDVTPFDWRQYLKVADRVLRAK